MLECHVTGTPVPSIVWRRDNNVITETSADYAVTQSAGICCLKIKRAGRDHAGQYSCSATNSGGEASTSATVNVICEYSAAVDCLETAASTAYIISHRIGLYQQLL